MKSSKMNLLILIIGVFFLSTSVIFAKVIDAPAVIIAFYRMLFSGLLMMPILVFNKELRREIKSFTLKQILLGSISGLLLASHYVLWFSSLDYTSVASSTVLVTLQPIFAVIGGYLFYKERVNTWGIVGILVAILGSCYVGWQDFQGDPTALYGDFLALLAAALITGYFFIGRSLRQNMGVLAYSILGYFTSALMLFVYGGIKGVAFNGFSSSLWLLLVAMALFSTIFGQMVINWVLKWLTTTTVSVVILTEVIWATLLSVIILGDIVTSKQAMGISIIVVGLLIYGLRDKLGLFHKGVGQVIGEGEKYV